MAQTDSYDPQDRNESSADPTATDDPRVAPVGVEHQDATAEQNVGNIAAFFDVDNTIIRGASAFHLARGLFQREFFGVSDLVAAGYHHIRYVALGESTDQIDSIRERALGVIKGHSVAELTAIGEEVYDQVLALRIYPGTRKILDEHLAAGHEVWLITATPIEIGELLARRLGATGALATVAEHKNGIYTGRLVGDMMHGQAKEQAVRKLALSHGLDLEKSYAYGDSVNDIPILSAVAYPCAINPEPRLRRHARDVGWPMREFRGKRRIAKRGMKTAGWAGGAWVLGLIARSIKRSLTR